MMLKPIPQCEYLILDNYAHVIDYSDGPSARPPRIYYTFQRENLPVTLYGLAISSRVFHSQLEEGLTKLGNKIKLKEWKHIPGLVRQHNRGVIATTYEVDKIYFIAIKQVLVDIVIGAIKDKYDDSHVFAAPTEPYREFIWSTYLANIFDEKNLTFSFHGHNVHFIKDPDAPAEPVKPELEPAG